MDRSAIASAAIDAFIQAMRDEPLCVLDDAEFKSTKAMVMSKIMDADDREPDPLEVAIDSAKIDVAYALDQCRAGATSQTLTIARDHARRAVDALERAAGSLQCDTTPVESESVLGGEPIGSEEPTPLISPPLSFGERDDFDARR